MKQKPPELFGLPIIEIARICRVSLKTAGRWKDGTSCPPETALMILRRDLGIFSAEWVGWTVNGGDLVSPDGWTISRNDALAVPLMHGQISALRSKVTELEGAENDGLEEQPTPDTFPELLTG